MVPPPPPPCISCALVGLAEKAYLFSSWIAPVCYLPARAYRPTDHVLSQLNLVHTIALGLNNWHLTMPIRHLPVKEGGLAQASLAAYAEWVHSQSFVRFVQRLAQFAERHVAPFQRWAFSVGLLIEEESPRREVVRSSAGTGVIYPPFWGSFA